MQSEIIHIKNMVCRRCVMTVEDICQELGLRNVAVSLGSVSFSVAPEAETLDKLYERLRSVGFEPLESQDLVLLEKIKAAVRFYVRDNSIGGKCKLSDCLMMVLKRDFRYISRMFSTMEGRTIQSYLMSQRVEYVKELLSDNELTLAEIADEAGFSSVAHLSRAFKNSQGITISEFRDTGIRIGIDEV